MRVAIQQLKEAKQHAFSLRQEHLEERARLYATMEDMGNKKAVDRLKRAELLSQTYRKLSSIRNPTSRGGITKIQVPLDPDTSPQTCHPDDRFWHTERVPTEIE